MKYTVVPHWVVKVHLTPVYVESVSLGGAVSISCTCNCYGNRGVIFETSSMYELGSATEISVAI